MRNVLKELRLRNAALYWFGWLCWLGALLSFILIWTANLEVSGVPAAIKPFKFCLSIAIAVWTKAKSSGCRTKLVDSLPDAPAGRAAIHLGYSCRDEY